MSFDWTVNDSLAVQPPLSPPQPSGAAVSYTVVSTGETTYIEFNPSAMALATEECLEQFRKRLITVVARRLAEAGKELSKSGSTARRGTGFASGFELNLVDD